MSAERLEERLTRLERERQEADRKYHDALTALDRAIQQTAQLPAPPPAYDEQQITPINQTWNILPKGAPPVDGSLKGRLRAFIWRLVGPPLEQQQQFNAAVVDHLNRNVATHREAEETVTALISLVRDHIQGAVAFQQHLIQYLQTVTLYIDTKDRAVAGQAQVLNAAIGALADDWMKRWESLTTREQRFTARVGAIDGGVDDLRSTLTAVQQLVLALKREVGRIGASSLPNAAEVHGAVGPPQALPIPVTDLSSVVYVGFEDRFRGSRDDIRTRLEQYLPLFDGVNDVVDVGCGRGELLDLLRQRGVTARGIDINDEMVDVCRERGLDATRADAVAYLAGQPDASIGGLIAIQVVEHLEPAYLLTFLQLAGQKLRPGSRMVLETINPACWLAFFESYVRDVTHVRPLHPDTLQYFVQASGFSRTEVRFTAPVPGDEKLETVGPAPAALAGSIDVLLDAFNANVARLNTRLFTYMDYAVVAVR